MELKIDGTIVFDTNWSALNSDARYIINEGGSRCHAPGTLIRMYDGSLKKVEDIIVGDKVSSIDGISFNIVTETHNGYDDMYLIKQGKGDNYIVNKNHLISVKQTRSKPYKKKVDGIRKEYFDAEYDITKIHHFSAEKWSNMSLRSRRIYSGFKETFLELPERDLKIDPYYLGLWLGDGSSSRPMEISTIDPEIIEYLNSFKEDSTFLEYNGRCTYKIRSNIFNKQIELSKTFYDENLVNNKHIPINYIYSSYDQRLRIIAGLIDSDGCSTKRNTLSFTNTNKNIIDGLFEILNISGFYTNGIRKHIAKMKRKDGSIYSVQAYTIEFNSPDFSDLNKYIKLERKKQYRVCNKHMFNSKIESEFIGKGEFFGFTLDKSPLYKLKDGTVTHNSSKTFSLCQCIILWALSNKDKAITIVRKASTTVRKSVMKTDFVPILRDMNLLDTLVKWNKSDATFTFPNNTVVNFIGADDEQKLRGLKHDICWMNEANELQYDDFQQIAMRTTGKIIIDYNPSANESYLYDLPPDKSIKIHSTYKDNPFLSKEQVDFIESYKETDMQYYTIFALGQRSFSRENVYTQWEVILEKPEYMKDYVIGLDFGFTHPTAMCKVWYCIDRNELYLEELIHESGLNSSDLIERFAELGISKSDEIIADYARPEIINQLREAGYNIINAIKDVKDGINNVKTFKIKVNHNAVNIIKENGLYKWKKVNGQITDDVVKLWDDQMDSLRYGVFYIKKFKSKGDIKVFTFKF